MKKCSCFFGLLTFALTSFFNSNYSQAPESKWEWLHPTPQGNVFRWCKAFNSSTWYMGGNHGTFVKTTNGGASWIVTNEGAKIGNIYRQRPDIRDAHFFNQNTGILVNSFGAATRTTNGGNTFDSIPALYYDGYGWNGIFFLNNSTGYVVGERGKFMKTTDGGYNWTVNTSIPTGSSVFYYSLFTMNDTLIFVGSYPGIIQRSSDGGTTCTTISTGGSSEVYKFCFINRDTGIACGRFGLVRLTTDAGLNWSDISAGLPTSSFPDIDLRMSGQTAEIYLTGNYQYVFKTTNLGTSWDTVGFWASGQSYMGIYHGSYATELLNGDTLVVVGTYGLINKRNSITDRILYTHFAKFGVAPIYDIWIEGSKIWAVGAPSFPSATFDQIIYSSDGGSSWVNQNIGNAAEIISGIYMINSNTGYITSTSGIVRKTNNGGLNWNTVSNPTSNSLQSLEFVNENTGWIYGASGTIYKTSDGASNWVQQTAQGITGYIYGSSMINDNTGWIVGVSGKVSKTEDGGANWIPQIPSSGGNLFDIDMLDANTGYLCGVQTVGKTSNGGINWETVDIPFPPNSNIRFTSVDFINPNTGMLLSTFFSLKTTNGGTSWIIDNLTTPALNSTNEGYSKLKMVSEDTAYMGGYYSSVLKYAPPSPIGITEWQTGIPKEYMLYQNYPNPFNPSTTIKFAIPKQGRVTLKVFDITGREARTILYDLELNPGTVKHIFNGSELASGVYFYSLYVDNALIETRKMVLIK